MFFIKGDAAGKPVHFAQTAVAYNGIFLVYVYVTGGRNGLLEQASRGGESLQEIPVYIFSDRSEEEMSFACLQAAN